MKTVYAVMAVLAVATCAEAAQAPYAQIYCSSGTVVEVGVPYYTPSVSIPFSYGIKLLCDEGQLFNDTTNSWPNYSTNPRMFELIGIFKDAQLAVALTAIAANKKVWYSFVSTAHGPEPGLNTKGHIATLYVKAK